MRRYDALDYILVASTLLYLSLFVAGMIRI